MLKQFVAWYQSAWHEVRKMQALKDDVLRFDFGKHTRQVVPSRDAHVYTAVGYPIHPKVDPEIGMAVRRYLISYYAGNKEAEMLERLIEAIAYVGVGSGLDKILTVNDVGRKSKTARGVLDKAVFGAQASRMGASILTVEEEARKQLSRHLYARLCDFDEFSPRDWIQRSILFSLSGETPIFIRKPFGKESDQMDSVWPGVQVILSLNCVPHTDTSEGDAAKDRFRVVQRHDVRFTKVEEEVDIAAGVFPLKVNLCTIWDNPAAAFLRAKIPSSPHSSVSA